MCMRVYVFDCFPLVTLFFCFKQKTAYEIRISDWSSDVCSSDLQWDIPELRRLLLEVIPKTTAVINYEVEHDFSGLGRRTMLVTARTLHHPDSGGRSMLLTIVDATERTRRNEAQDILFVTRRHRMKNPLVVTQSNARHSATVGR